MWVGKTWKPVDGFSKYSEGKESMTWIGIVRDKGEEYAKIKILVLFFWALACTENI